MANTQARFFDLIRLKQQMDADSEIPLRELRRRDHDLGQAITSSDPLSRLLAWLTCLETDQAKPKTINQQHQQLAHLEGLLVFSLCAVGLVVGIGSMSGILFANQQQPVNVLIFLGLFVGLQLVFVLLTLVGALLPLSQSAAHSPLSFLNPATWAFTLIFKRSLRSISHSLPWHQVPELTKLMVLRWGQSFAICFNLGLILSFWLALLVSDRTFAWSSTLNVSDTLMFNLLHNLALPWSWILNDGGVNASLVSDTRFQSLQTQFSAAQVAAMRNWWPFLLGALITYGLLPRVILGIVFNIRFRHQLKSTLLHYPGVKLVLDRLNAPLITTQPASAEEAHPIDQPFAAETTAKVDSNSWLVNWCGAFNTTSNPSTNELTNNPTNDLGFSPVNTVSAGLKLEQDSQVIDQVNHLQPNTVVIAVKSWEPPLAELSDFISAIDEQIQCVLLLMPLNNKSISAAEWKDWQHFSHHKLSRPIQLMKADGGPNP